MTADEIIALNDQIAGMAKAGLPLDQGLAGLAKEMGHGRLRSVTAAIAKDLEAGMPLSEAVAQRQNELPPFYSHLITAGIRTGRLSEVLATLTAYARTVSATRSLVIESLFYPTIVLTFGVILIAALVIFVLPMFDEIFKDYHMTLPAVTEWVLALGRHPIAVIVIPTCLFIAVLLTWIIMRSSTHGRQVLARMVYGVPVIGTLIRAARLAAFADLLAILVEQEMPLPQAVRLAGEASSDPLMAGRIGVVHDRLTEGAAFGASLRGLGLLPEWVAWMAGAGELRGALVPALRQIAAIYRRQVDSRAAMLRTVLPAVLIIFVAGVPVAGFILTVMPPLYKLLDGMMR